MMPAPGPRLLRTILVRGSGAFFESAGPFFPLSLDFVFVLNWFLLHCVCFFRFDGFFHSRCFCRALTAVCSPPICLSAYQASPPRRTRKMSAPTQFGTQ